MTPEQRAVVARAVATAPSFDRVLAEAERVGVSPADVLAYLGDPDESPFWDWLSELLDWFEGDEEEAQRAIDEARLPLPPDDVRTLALEFSVRRLIERGAPLAELEGRLRALGPAAAPYWRQLAGMRPLPEVLAERARFPLDALQALTRRHPAPDLADAVLAAVPEDEAERWLVALFGRIARGASTLEGRIRARAAIHRDANRSLWELVPWAEGLAAFPGWLGPLIDAGFSPTFAALATLERGWSIPATAALLLERGVAGDELLAALRDCGIGADRAIEALHRVGWSPAALVATSRAAGLLDPEIREQLRALRVPDPEIADLLSTAVA